MPVGEMLQRIPLAERIAWFAYFSILNDREEHARKKG